ncbi:MAG: D-glycero-beta-D-manno-heptose 1-phosphate adenylyltransferase [Syntrophobacteraceae bacterium]|jgi:D-beta-D-heptose 7-phosphate kinase/D-beta-D-heptose 1-phosphate adenosyltransferase|nr:D-glycero-beta-D-manno-heptose 1-phosphate adenylyltransferase [Syntrophobacteraceae bacterium]
MRARDKVKSAAETALICRTLRGEGRIRVVFTNGCFDLLHLGHLRYLEEARSLGDLLVVGINSDASVRRIKGALRPIQGESERSELLAGLCCVDYVVVFDTPDPLPLIEAIQPDILVKGADWPEDQIVGAEAVKRTGGRVERIPLTPERSTTSIVRKVIDRYGRDHQDHSR